MDARRVLVETVDPRHLLVGTVDPWHLLVLRFDSKPYLESKFCGAILKKGSVRSCVFNCTPAYDGIGVYGR